jgi:hypothetical protein
MARMIGQTKSWLWWLAGTLCALVFSAAARAGEAVAKKYGAPEPIRPPINNPAVTEEQKQKAEKLVVEYVVPVAAAEPTAEQKAAIDKLIAGLGSKDFQEREAASAAVVNHGPAALAALRAAAKSQDVEVSTRAGVAIAAIETAARQGLVAELKKDPGAAQVVVAQKLNEASAAQTKATQAAAEADKAGSKDEADKLRAEAKTATELTAALRGLQRAVSPMMMAPVYGVQAPVYGVRVPLDEK